MFFCASACDPTAGLGWSSAAASASCASGASLTWGPSRATPTTATSGSTFAIGFPTLTVPLTLSPTSDQLRPSSRRSASRLWSPMILPAGSASAPVKLAVASGAGLRIPAFLIEPSDRLQARQVAGVIIAVETNERFGGGHPDLTSAPLRHDLVVLPPDAPAVLADVREQGGLFPFDH